MTRAEQVRKRYNIAKQNVEQYQKLQNSISENTKKLFEFILEVFEKNARELIFTDLYFFDERAIDIKEYSLHKDGLYHFNDIVFPFEPQINVERFMNEVKFYVEQYDGYRAYIQPYQRRYNEPLMHYLQISVR